MSLGIPSLPIGLTNKSAMDQQIRAIFAGGRQGVWRDTSDRLTLFQDAARTIPVTAPGQPLGSVLDKSGRGNHATYANCTWEIDGSGRGYISYNGSTASGQSAAIDFSGSDKITVCAGMAKASDATVGVFLELSVSSTTTDGSFTIFAPGGVASPTVGFRSRGTIATTATSPASYAAPVRLVVTGIGDIGADIAEHAQVTEGLADVCNRNHRAHAARHQMKRSQ